MEKMTKSMAAGILDIIAGVVGLIGTVLLFIGFIVTSGACGIPGIAGILSLVPGLILGLAVPLAILGILAIVGGVYALRRKIWGLALAGSTAALLTSWPWGIAAVVFTVTSKNEFE